MWSDRQIVQTKAGIDMTPTDPEARFAALLDRYESHIMQVVMEGKSGLRGAVEHAQELAKQSRAALLAMFREARSHGVFEPTPGLLMSMALRYDHSIAMPIHADRLRVMLDKMEQVYEEVVGLGFYKPDKEAEYAGLVSETGEKA